MISLGIWNAHKLVANNADQIHHWSFTSNRQRHKWQKRTRCRVFWFVGHWWARASVRNAILCIKKRHGLFLSRSTHCWSKNVPGTWMDYRIEQNKIEIKHKFPNENNVHQFHWGNMSYSSNCVDRMPNAKPGYSSQQGKLQSEGRLARALQKSNSSYTRTVSIATSDCCTQKEEHKLSWLRSQKLEFSYSPVNYHFSAVVLKLTAYLSRYNKDTFSLLKRL